MTCSGCAAQVGGDPQCLAHGEDGHGDHHDVQAVSQQGLAEREPALAR